MAIKIPQNSLPSYPFYSNIENLVLRARSEIEGSASELCD